MPLDFLLDPALPLFFQLLHDIGYVFGTGGATILNALNFFGPKSEEFRKSKVSISIFILNFILLGLASMLVVHTAEFLAPHPASVSLLISLKFLVIWLLVPIIYYIRFGLIPEAQRNPTPEIQRKLKTVPLFGLALWWADFILNSVFLQPF